MSTPFDVQEDPTSNNRKRQIANEKLSDDEFVRSALKSRAGRNYFWRFLERCHLFEVSYVQGSFDATSFREGERNIGQRMLADVMRIAPESWIEMMKEHQRKPAVPVEELEDAS